MKLDSYQQYNEERGKRGSRQDSWISDKIQQFKDYRTNLERKSKVEKYGAMPVEENSQIDKIFNNNNIHLVSDNININWDHPEQYVHLIDHKAIGFYTRHNYDNLTIFTAAFRPQSKIVNLDKLRLYITKFPDNKYRYNFVYTNQWIHSDDIRTSQHQKEAKELALCYGDLDYRMSDDVKIRDMSIIANILNSAIKDVLHRANQQNEIKLKSETIEKYIENINLKDEVEDVLTTIVDEYDCTLTTTVSIDTPIQDSDTYWGRCAIGIKVTMNDRIPTVARYVDFGTEQNMFMSNKEHRKLINDLHRCLEKYESLGYEVNYVVNGDSIRIHLRKNIDASDAFKKV